MDMTQNKAPKYLLRHYLTWQENVIITGVFERFAVAVAEMGAIYPSWLDQLIC